MKKVLAIVLLLLVLAAMALFVGSGFIKRTDVHLVDFLVSEDGSSLRIQAGPSGSMGYIRGISVQQKDSGLYCSFYCAFGGLNSKLGAKSSFDIPLDDSCTEVFFHRGGNQYTLVLQKDPLSGVWTKK